MRYIQGTLNYGIIFEKDFGAKLVGYCHSDWGGNIDDMKSTSGYIFSFGSGVFSWSLKKQQTVAQSSYEAEYVLDSLATS